MAYTKHIRPGYKKRVKTGVKTGVKTPINRRPGWVPGGSVVCWRLLGCWRMVWPVVDGWRLLLQAGGCLPFWGPEMQGGRAAAGVGGAVGGVQGGGAMVCRRWPSGWLLGAIWAAAGGLPVVAGRR